MPAPSACAKCLRQSKWTNAAIAMGEPVRLARYLNVARGAWIVASPFGVGGASPTSTPNAVVVGAALVLLSLPRGPVLERYGGWSRYVAQPPRAGCGRKWEPPRWEGPVTPEHTRLLMGLGDRATLTTRGDWRGWSRLALPVGTAPGPPKPPADCARGEHADDIGGELGDVSHLRKATHLSQD